MTARTIRSRFLAHSALAGCLVLFPVTAFAQTGPANGTVAAGGATIGQAGAKTTVTQTSDKAIINWGAFNLGSGASFDVTQPSAAAMLLNRDLSGRPSLIDGSVTANGRVWIINAQGITFGENARVNVGGLVASTLDVSDADFLDSDNRFRLTNPGVTFDTAAIRTRAGAQLLASGSIALVSPQINLAKGSSINSGGQAIIGAGSDVHIQFVPARTDDLDLFSFVANGQTAISSTNLSDPITISGDIAAKQIYAVAMNRVNVVGLIQFDGTLVANGAASDGQGGILLSNSGGGVTSPGTLGAGWFRSQIRGYTGGSGSPILQGTMLADSLSVNGASGTFFRGNGTNIRHIKNVDTDFSFDLSTDAGGVIEVGNVISNNGSFSLSAYNAAINFQKDILAASVIVGAGYGITGKNFESQATDRTTTTFLQTLNGDIRIGGIKSASTILGQGGFGGTKLIALRGNVFAGAIESSEIQINAAGTATLSARPTVTAGLYTIEANGFSDLTLSPLFSGSRNSFIVNNTGSSEAIIRDVSLNGALRLTGQSFTLRDVTAASMSAADSSVLRLTLGGRVAVERFGITTNRIDQIDGSLIANAVELRTRGFGARYDLFGANRLTGNGAELRLTDPSGGATLRFNQVATDRIGYVGNVAAATFMGQSTGLLDLRTAGALDLAGIGDYGLGVTVRAGGAITVAGEISASRTLIDMVASGALTINGRLSAPDVAMAATTLDNRFGAGAISTGANGKWAIYLDTPAGNNFNGLDSGQTALWGNSRASILPGAITGNRYIFAFRPTLTIQPGSVSKTYGDNLNPATVGSTITGVQAGVAGAYLGDTTATAYSGTPTLSSGGFNARASVAGSPWAITVDPGSVIALNGYQLNLREGFVTILAKQLNVGIAANDKTYDATTNATGLFSLDGVLFDDVVSATGSLSFADKNAGANKRVNAANVTLTGAGASNYTLGTVGSTVASIAQKALLANASINTRAYDGTVNATGTVNLSGIVTGDIVSVEGVQFTFADKNAGEGKAVRVIGGALGGADSANYTLGPIGDATGTILRRSVDVGIAANDKTYDGTTDATGRVTSLANVVAGDDIAVTGGSFRFAARNAGASVLVTADGLQLTGSDAGNYVLSGPPTTVANILARAITADVRINTKTYDGTTMATGAVTALNGVIAGDSVGASGGKFAFADKNAGSNKAVSATGVTLSGDDAGNYVLTLPSNLFGTIEQRTLTGNIGVVDKTYDGTTNATGSIALDGVIAGDVVGTTSGSFAFADKNVGSGKTVSVAGITLTGGDAGNYSLVLPTQVTASILRRIATIIIAADGKIYDGSANASGRVTGIDNLVAGDEVRVAGGSYAFDNRNAGTAKRVVGTGFVVGGADAGNYQITLSASAFADVLRKAIIGYVAIDDKTYDGTTSATGRVTLSGMVAGDVVETTGGTFTFSDRNAGSGKTVLVKDVALSGTDAGNYTLTITGNALASITRKTIDADVRADDKVYDGSTNATASVALRGAVAGDVVSAAGGSFKFADRNAGTGKSVSVDGITLTGADAGNYSLTFPRSVLAAITPRSLTAKVAVDDKVYDGTTVATGQVMLAGLIAGDIVSTTGSSFAFTDKNAGVGKTVSVGGVVLTGSDASNYTLTLPATVMASILRRALTATVTVNSKTYDGSVEGSGNVALNGVLAGDQVSAANTRFTFKDANAGTGKAVAVQDTTLTGGDAGNYTVTVPGSALADILRRAVTIAISDSKKREGATDPAFDFTVEGELVSGDMVAGAANREPGEAPGQYSILPGTLSLSDNYTVSFTNGTFTITPVPRELVDAAPDRATMLEGADTLRGFDDELLIDAACTDETPCPVVVMEPR